jgi:hypothetical protein
MNYGEKSVNTCKRKDKLKQTKLFVYSGHLTQDLLQKRKEGRLFSNTVKLI